MNARGSPRSLPRFSLRTKPDRRSNALVNRFNATARFVFGIGETRACDPIPMRSDLMSMCISCCRRRLSIVVALLSLHCTAASTSVVAPTFDKCQISATTGQSSFAPAGGSGSLAINAARDCTWTATADAPWVRIIGEFERSRRGRPAFLGRREFLCPFTDRARFVVGSQRTQISQTAAPCVFELSQTHKSVPASGEQVSVGVTTLEGCAWTAETSRNWIAISSGRSGNGPGTVVVVRCTEQRASADRPGEDRREILLDHAGRPPPAPNPSLRSSAAHAAQSRAAAAGSAAAVPTPIPDSSATRPPPPPPWRTGATSTAESAAFPVSARTCRFPWPARALARTEAPITDAVGAQ